jgi:Sel1 repeat
MQAANAIAQVHSRRMARPRLAYPTVHGLRGLIGLLLVGLQIGIPGLHGIDLAQAQGGLLSRSEFLPPDMDDRAGELNLSSLARQVLGVEWAMTPSMPSVMRNFQQRVLEKAAQAGDPRAAYALASAPGTDVKKAFQLTLVAAQAGSLDAQFRLAQILAVGAGVEKNPELALEWLVLAARGGHSGARQVAQDGKIPWQNAGSTIEYLQGLKRDEAAYKAWYEFALTGLPTAAYQVGQRLFQGQGVAMNKVEAMRWMGRAAQHAHAPALYVLGQVYAAGEGVPRNIEEGLAWLQLAQAKTTATDLRNAIQADIQRLQGQVTPESTIALRVLLPDPERRGQAGKDRELR